MTELISFTLISLTYLYISLSPNPIKTKTILKEIPTSSKSITLTKNALSFTKNKSSATIKKEKQKNWQIFPNSFT